MISDHDKRSNTEDRALPGLQPITEGAGTEGDAELITRGDGTVSWRTSGPCGVQDKPVEEVSSEVDSKQPILWHSNAPWVGSGYGTQSRLFGPLIDGLGYPLAFSSFHGLQGSRQPWISPSGKIYVVYPVARDGYGNDVLVAHSRHWFSQCGHKSGLVVLLTDPWVIRTEVASSCNMIAWCPVDHSPLMPNTAQWFAKGGAFPVAMSKFGKQMMEEAGMVDVAYVPHGFDPAVFRPQERAEAREVLGLPRDAFVVGMVAANVGGYPSRKNFSEAFQAFAIFQSQHNDAILYLHTALQHPLGENLPSLCQELGIKPYTVDQYGLVLGMPDSMVATTLNSFDVLLNPAAGEGFGVPLIEAQACGTPCIVTNFSAMPEVAPVEMGNWAVEGQKRWTQFQSWQITPSVEALVVALEMAYSEPAVAREARRKSVYQFSASYEAERVVRDFWQPTLVAAAEEFRWRGKQMRQFKTTT